MRHATRIFPNMEMPLSDRHPPVPTSNVTPKLIPLMVITTTIIEFIYLIIDTLEVKKTPPNHHPKMREMATQPDR